MINKFIHNNLRQVKFEDRFIQFLEPMHSDLFTQMRFLSSITRLVHRTLGKKGKNSF